MSHNLNKLKTIILPSTLWFFAGADLILLPLLSTEVEKLYFPNDNPVNSILVVYATLSLSLLARVFGGLYFGRLGDIYGRKTVVMICFLVISIIMIISAFLPSIFNKETSLFSSYPYFIIPLSFIITRISIGFFVGGLWPTAGVLAIENSYWLRFKKDYKDEEFNIAQILFKNATKKMTRESAAVQVGFFAGYLVAAVLVSFINKDLIGLHNLFNDSLIWRTMSLLLGVFGLILWVICYFYLDESEEWLKWSKKWKDHEIQLVPGIKSLLNSDKYREILISFWLILTGLMYMYYSTIITSTELFKRDTIADHPVTLILLLMTLVAHLWAGIFCYYAWIRKFKFSMYDTLRNYKTKFSVNAGRFVGVKYDSSCQSSKGTDDLPKVKEESNLDIRLIAMISFVLVFLGIGGSVLVLLSSPGPANKAFTISYFSIVILVANAGWALIPSMTSSRFPIHIRNTGASLSYNGGLAISFASPFVILEFYMNLRSEYILFLPMILGSISMIIGAARLMRVDEI